MLHHLVSDWLLSSACGFFKFLLGSYTLVTLIPSCNCPYGPLSPSSCVYISIGHWCEYTHSFGDTGKSIVLPIFSGDIEVRGSILPLLLSFVVVDGANNGQAVYLDHTASLSGAVVVR
jgi:hypothetical protein